MNKIILNALGLTVLTYLVSLLFFDWYWFFQNLAMM